MASLFRKTRTRYVDADGVRTTKDGDARTTAAGQIEGLVRAVS
ncbi:MAG: hypothetical protein R3C02_03150 [Planctomycetaceae bacterium]